MLRLKQRPLELYITGLWEYWFTKIQAFKVTATAEQLQQRLRDIRGLDPWQWWHLPLGWWLLLAGLALLLLAYMIYHRRALAWQREAKRQLLSLRQQIKQQQALHHNEYDVHFIAELSELLRRIAMARLGRAACAGLSGLAWLRWLQQHDPQQFDWPRYQAILIQYNYLPPDQTVIKDIKPQLQQMINAMLLWVKT